MQYIITAYDGTDKDALTRRMNARPHHLENIQKVKEKGITPGPVISPNPHTRFFFIPDPNGVQIQFIEEK